MIVNLEFEDRAYYKILIDVKSRYWESIYDQGKDIESRAKWDFAAIEVTEANADNDNNFPMWSIPIIAFIIISLIAACVCW